MLKVLFIRCNEELHAGVEAEVKRRNRAAAVGSSELSLAEVGRALIAERLAQLTKKPTKKGARR